MTEYTQNSASDLQILPSMRTRVTQLLPNVWTRAAASVAFMLLLVCIVSFFGTPNPNMILISGLVVCASLMGLAGGISAASVMLGYSQYFFSIDHSWVSFTPENLQKVAVVLVGVVVVTGFVCMLERAERRSYQRLVDLTVLLKEDNRLLSQASSVDALTGTQNRFSLRRDYEKYARMDAPLLVAMLDVDDFKHVNDTYGHEVGDYILSNLGNSLRARFGQECVYRYGGDEFLMVLPNKTGVPFEHDVAGITDDLSCLEFDGEKLPADISVGYVVGRTELSGDLRLMMREADQKLYESKNAGKSCVTGGAFAR